MAKRVVYVMLPIGSRAEMTLAREALARHGWNLSMCSASAHSPGQALYGDVLVVGPGMAGVDADVKGADGKGGKVWRVPDLAALARFDPFGKAEKIKALNMLDEGLAEKAVAAVAAAATARKSEAAAWSTPTGAAVVVPEPVKSEPAPKPAKPEPEPKEDDVEDQLDGMNRVELMQHAAKRWPGARQWATLNNDRLKDAIRELGG